MNEYIILRTKLSGTWGRHILENLIHIWPILPELKSSYNDVTRNLLNKNRAYYISTPGSTRSPYSQNSPHSTLMYFDHGKYLAADVSKVRPSINKESDDLRGLLTGCEGTANKRISDPLTISFWKQNVNLLIFIFEST